jgi:hypothetical protein
MNVARNDVYCQHSALNYWKMNMNLSRTTLKKAHAYLGVCEFCGTVGELSYYDSVLESAVCGECAQDLATGENELLSAGMVPPGSENFDGLGS